MNKGGGGSFARQDPAPASADRRHPQKAMRILERERAGAVNNQAGALHCKSNLNAFNEFPGSVCRTPEEEDEWLRSSGRGEL